MNSPPIRSATIDVFEEVLQLGLNSPFNMVYEQQQYASSIVYNEVRPPRIFWDAGISKVSIEGETLDLVVFREGLQKIIVRVADLIDKINGGRIFASKLPDVMKDDLPNDTRGYSWLDHGPFTENPNALLIHLVDNSDWDICWIDAFDNLQFNKPACVDILSNAAEVNKLLMFLNHILPSLPGRIKELADQKIRNDLRPRNLHYIIRDMFWLRRYHKGTNSTGHDACIPSFIPPVLVKLMTEYLAGGLREVEEILTRVVYGKEASDLIHTCVLSNLVNYLLLTP